MVVENIQIYSVQVTGKYVCETLYKTEIRYTNKIRSKILDPSWQTGLVLFLAELLMFFFLKPFFNLTF